MTSSAARPNAAKSCDSKSVSPSAGEIRSPRTALAKIDEIALEAPRAGDMLAMGEFKVATRRGKLERGHKLVEATQSATLRRTEVEV